MESTIRLSASCALGLEKVAAEELSRHGFGALAKSAGRIGFETDREGLARALVRLRTVDRLFIEAGRFPAGGFDALFEGSRAIPWERWVGPDDRLVIEKARAEGSKLAAQNAIQSVCLKGAYERLSALYKTPTMPETGNSVMARIRIDSDQATVEIDACGEALSKRGYRKRPTEAPLKETVAAAILFMAGWKRSIPLYDPFCGSGTVPIEAALYAFGIAPGLKRGFSWEKMPDCDRDALEAVRKESKARAEEAMRASGDDGILIAGSDLDESALEAAKANAGLAGIASKIRLFKASAIEAAPFAERGLVVADPPYGKRLGTPAEADRLYASLGAFAARFSAWDLCFVVDREDFGGFAGERAVPGATGAWKRARIIDGAETRWVHRSIAGASARRA